MNKILGIGFIALGIVCLYIVGTLVYEMIVITETYLESLKRLH